VYWWRVLAIAADGRRGAWSEAQAFVLRPTPRAALVQLSPDGSALELLWGGNPDDRVEVELARDAQPRAVVAHAQMQGQRGRLARPAAGRYLVRYRFVEPDGFKTSWSEDTRIVVDGRWGEAWRGLLPAAWPR